MKQNFQMGTIYGEEGICAQYDRDFISTLLPNGAIQKTPTKNITNLRPVTVLDIAPDELSSFLRRCYSIFWTTAYSYNRKTVEGLLSQLTPTPAPKNEVGKVCVTEPLNKCALVQISDTNTEYVSLDSTSHNVSHKRWVCVQTGNLSSWEDLNCYSPILLSEGVEG